MLFSYGTTKQQTSDSKHNPEQKDNAGGLPFQICRYIIEPQEVKTTQHQNKNRHINQMKQNQRHKHNFSHLIFDKGAKNMLGKERIFNKWCQEADVPMQKNGIR